MKNKTHSYRNNSEGNCMEDKTLKAYKTAVDEKYRFFSFGDCMMIL